MPSFNDIFDANPQLSSLPVGEKIALTNQAYDLLKKEGGLNNAQLRQFRQDQMDTLYDEDVRSGAIPKEMSPENWKKATVDPGSFGYAVSSPNQELVNQLAKRDLREDLRATKDVVTDWSSYPKAAAKFGADIIQLGGGLGRALVQGHLPGGSNPLEAFSQGMEATGKSAPVQAVNKWYEDAIKDDPELYKAYHAALTDATIGSLFGIGRAGKAAKLAAEAGEALSGMSRARMLMAPVTSNVLGGQVVYRGLEGLDKNLADSQMTDTQKNGVRLAALLGAGLASGFTIEPVIERLVQGEAKLTQAVHNLGQAAEGAKAGGKTFLQEIEENPNLSEDFKEVILAGARSPEEAAQMAPNFDGISAAAKADFLIEAERKVAAGEELASEEAAALQGARPEPFTEPLAQEEIVRFTPQQNLTPFESLSSPYWRGETEIRVTPATPDIPKDATPFFSSIDEYGGFGWREQYKSGINKEISPIPPREAALGMQGRMPYGKATLNQRGLTTIDQLTQEARRLAADPEANAQALTELKQYLSDVHATMAIANEGLTSLTKQARKELGEAKQRLTQLEAKGKETASPELKQTLREQWQQEAQRVRTIQDRITVLERQPKEAFAEAPSYAPGEQAVREAANSFQKEYKQLKKIEEAGKKNPTDELRRKWLAQKERADEKQGILERLREKKATQMREGAESNAAQVASRDDVLTRMGELSPEQQLRVRQISEAVTAGRENILARPLTEEEKLDTLAKVYSDSQNWSARLFEPSDTPTAAAVLPDGTTVRGISGGWMEDKYPKMARLAAVLQPDSRNLGVVAPDTILRAMQDMVDRSGFGMLKPEYELSREVMREGFELWDEVKTGLQKGTGETLEQALKLNAGTLGLTKKQADSVATSIRDAFPDLDVAFQFGGALPKGASATADGLTRLITVGMDKVGLNELMHELGHLHFYYGLDADAKLAWLDNMRRGAEDETLWANAFPGYADRIAAIKQLEATDPAAAVAQAIWVHSPAEMYAQQFSSFVLDSVIPRVDTLTTLGRLQAGVKKLVGVSMEEFEKLTPETREFFLRTLAQPDAVDARRAVPQEIDEALQANWMFSPRDEAVTRVEELTRELDETYSGRLVSAEQMGETELDLAAQQAQTGVGQGYVDFFSRPPADRVMGYALEDLPKVMEAQALRLLYDLPNASLEELQLASARMQTMLSGANLPDLMDRMVKSRREIQSKYNPDFDPAAGQSYSRGERGVVAQDERLTDFNRLDTDAQQRVMMANKLRWKVKLGAMDMLLQEYLRKLDTPLPLGAKEKEAWVRGALFNTPPRNAAEAAFRQTLPERAEPFDAIRAGVEQELAALDRQLGETQAFANLVLAKKGLIDLVDDHFGLRMSQADMFAKLPQTQQGQLFSPVRIFGNMARLGYCGVAGLEYNPNGTYLPGLGHVRWNPEKFFSSPLNALMIPGAWRATKFAGKQGGKLAHLGLSKLPENIQRPLTETLDAVKRGYKAVFTEGQGLPSELQDLPSRSRVFGRLRKGDFLEFGEVFLRHFNAKERALIGRMVGKEAGWKGLTRWALDYRPDVLAAVDATRKLTDKIGEDFQKLGVYSDRFGDLKGSYLSRFYSNIGKKSLKAIFETSNIRPIKMDLLNRRGIAETIKNTKAGGLPNKTFTEFKEHLDALGLDITPDMKVNAYKTPGGQVKYAVPDSPLDKSFAAQLTPYHVWGESTTGYLVEDSTRSSVKLRRDYTQHERRLMGEVMDVSVRLAYMGERLEQQYRRAHMFKGIADSRYVIDPNKPWQEVAGFEGVSDAQWLVEQAKHNDAMWKLVPDTVDKNTGINKYGALSGCYVHKDVWNAMQLLDGFTPRWQKGSAMGDAIGAYRWALNKWKLTKTVASPIAHINNFVSNLFMGFVLGDNPIVVLRDGIKLRRLRNMENKAKQLVKEGKQQEAADLLAKAEQDPMYPTLKLIKESGMADSSMWTAELKSEDLVKVIQEEANKGSGTEAGGMLSTLWAGMKSIGRGAAHLYEDGDLLFKMGSFHNAMKRGMSASDALRHSYEAYFDYSTLAPAAKLARDTGLVPFISYMYKAVPALTKALTEHPERVAIVALALEGIHQASVAALYGPDETVKMSEALDAAAPTYLGKRSLGGLFRSRIALPTSGPAMTQKGQEKIQAQYLDLSRMLPGGDMMEVGSTGVNDFEFSLRGAGEALSKVLLQNPLMSLALNAQTKQNIALGIQMNTGGALDDPRVQERVNDEWNKQFWNTVAPNWPILPYTYSNKALMEGLVGAGVLSPGSLGTYGAAGTDAEGIAKPLTTALMGQVGVKVRSFVPESMLQHKIKQQAFELNREKGRLNSIFRNQANSQERKQEERELFRQTKAKFQEDNRKRVEFLNRLREARRTAQGGKTLPH